MRALLNAVASFLWSTGSLAARRFAREGKRLDARVIGVGNLQAGGAGKTPLVAELARQAHARGLLAAVLCRGYGSRWESRGGVIAPGAPCPAAEECGDEAALLHELAPEAWIGVGADRGSQFEEIRRLAGRSPEIAILDDAFQNHRLKKDLEIVALTSAGRRERVFRDFESALACASLVVWTKGPARPLAWEGPALRARFELEPAPSGDPVLLVTGVGDGAHVLECAKAAGYRVQRHLRFPDHARYADRLVQGLVEDARGKRMKLALTGKDWVKWKALVPETLRDSLIWVLEPSVRLDPQDEKLWNQVIWRD